MDRHEITDEDLTAYLDGEAGRDLSERIEHMLVDDDKIRTRLDALKIDKKLLSTAMNASLAAAPSPPSILMDSHAQASRVPGNWYRFAMAACVFFAVGFSGGLYLDKIWDPTPIPAADQKAELSSWRDYAAAYHTLYTTETLGGPEPRFDEIAAQFKTVSAALGQELDPADYLNFKGMSFRRAQVLGFQDRPLIQIAYLTEDGVPVALCLIHSQTDDTNPATGLTALAMVPRFGMSSAQWDENGLSFLLVGGADDQRIKDIALQATENL